MYGIGSLISEISVEISEKCEKATTILLIKTNARVVSVKNESLFLQHMPTFGPR